MDTHTCYTCNINKPKSEFFRDSQSPHKVKNHCKVCMTVKKQEFRKNIIIPDKIICKICKEEKTAELFDSDFTVKRGKKNTCKKCLSVYNKSSSQTWEYLVRKKVVYSWKSHNNEKMENKVEIEDAMKLLKAQKFMCAHCKHELSCETGDLFNKNWWVASLDRIDVNIIGYKNNCQWLCMSCNNGKNTMPNEEHLAKFKGRDDKIQELLHENTLLKDKLLKLENILKAGCE